MIELVYQPLRGKAVRLHLDPSYSLTEVQRMVDHALESDSLLQFLVPRRKPISLNPAKIKTIAIHEVPPHAS